MNIVKKLQELEELRQVLIGELRKDEGDTDAQIKKLEAAQPMIEYGSKGHEALLAAGYGFDKKKAETIIRERRDNPAIWPYEMFEKAEAFMEALGAGKPTPSSTRKPWRTRPRRSTQVR